MKIELLSIIQTWLQLQDREEHVNAGIAPYSASYKRVLIKTILDDSEADQKLVCSLYVTAKYPG